MFRTILSLLVVFTLLNTYVGKTIHELFFHHEGVHCDAVNEKHFHTIEYHGEDLVCTFNFSASSEASNKNHHFFSFLNEKTIVSEYLTVFINKNTNKNSPLRGPPTA
ncbi:MAG: hypothetical protein CVT95_00500 [Bacteroidetes bacterium HGW-Bacteroidetes-12]|nr:MAG: hypothetical protein CVT95_00500 [Bacteroidetes bacterium HGW-Bacteroidetes-12]